MSGALALALALKTATAPGNAPLPGSLFDLNFAAGAYWPSDISTLVSTVRAQTVPSYAFTSSGLLVPFAANTTRITDLGALSEDARINQLLQSNAFTTTWSKAATTTFTPNSGTDPTGSNNAWQWAGSANFSYFNQLASGGTTSGATYTAQIWLAPRTLGQVRLQFGSIDGLNTASATFNALTGAPVSHTTIGTGVYVNSGSIVYPNGWILLWVAGSYTGTAGAMIVDNPSGTGNCLFWQADVQLGAFPTSPIPTTTVAVARATDKIVYPHNPLGAGNFTMFVSVGGVAVQTGKFPTLLSVNDGSGVNETQLYSANGGNTASGKEQITVSIFDNVIPVSIVNGAGKVAMTLNGTAVRGASNGGNVTALGTWTPSAAFTQMQIGTNNGGTNNALNGYIKRVAVFQTGMNDAQLQALTA